MPPFRRRSILLIHFISTLVICGCSTQGVPSKTAPKPPRRVPSGGVLLQGAGGTLPAILYQKWFSTYENQHPIVAVSYDAVGSGEGIRRFIGENVKDEEKIDFGGSDAAMRDDELARVHGGAILLPVTAASVALAYNLPDLTGQLKLSRDAYSGIFLGKIKNWNDPRIARTNPGIKFPNLSIAIVVRQESSGTTYALSKHLDAINDSWRAQFGAATVIDWPGNAMRAKGNEGVAGAIQHSLGAIGYVSYEYAYRLGLRVALLENRERQFVAPSNEHAAAALARTDLPKNLRVFVADPDGINSYPIVTLSWILLYKN
ncbi:MAG: phosphate ABC transporter substrate-binding protein PstS, partial [Acidobacteria bacterium]|nr:phosphate ABC transporter substrate-binding protein PstS [Acidobacteriota bacterium]